MYVIVTGHNSERRRVLVALLRLSLLQPGDVALQQRVVRLQAGKHVPISALYVNYCLLIVLLL